MTYGQLRKIDLDYNLLFNPPLSMVSKVMLPFPKATTLLACDEQAAVN